jgi:hypothetical protein
MDKSSPFTISVSPFEGRPGRYQWTIQEDGEHRDKSRESFATTRETHLDAERHVDKLIASAKAIRDDQQ